MDSGAVETFCDAAVQLLQALSTYASAEASQRTPEDDAAVRQLRVAAGAIATALMEVARMVPPPSRQFNRRHRTLPRHHERKTQTVQDVFLTHLRERKAPVTIFLMNGIKLQGTVDWFDKFSVVLRRDRHSQLVYKSTIATIAPVMAVQLFDGDGSPQQAKAPRSMHAYPLTV